MIGEHVLLRLVKLKLNFSLIDFKIPSPQPVNVIQVLLQTFGSDSGILIIVQYGCIVRKFCRVVSEDVDKSAVYKR